MAALPVRDDGVTMPCEVCGQLFTVLGRRRYCSAACRQASYRRRHEPSRRPLDIPRHRPMVYQCPACEERYLDVRRCPDCNLFCRNLGQGGRCPNCDEPVTVQEILGGGLT